MLCIIRPEPPSSIGYFKDIEEREDGIYIGLATDIGYLAQWHKIEGAHEIRRMRCTEPDHK
jgi:hypothetical protein